MVSGLFPAEVRRRREGEWLVDSGENWRLDCFASLAMTLLAMTSGWGYGLRWCVERGLLRRYAPRNDGVVE